MATLLDIGLLQHVKLIFPLLLVFLIVFMALEKTNVFGEGNRSLNAIVAVCAAALLLLSPNLLKVITVITPWFVFALIAIAFFLVIFLFSGYTMEELVSDMTGDWGFSQWFLMVVFIIFIIGGLSTVYGQAMLPWAGDQPGQPGYTSDYVDAEGNVANAPIDDVRAAQAEGDFSTDTGDFSSNVGRIVFHPKILGMVLVLIIFSFAVRLLATAD